MFRGTVVKIEVMVTEQNEKHDKNDNSQKYCKNICEKKTMKKNATATSGSYDNNENQNEYLFKHKKITKIMTKAIKRTAGSIDNEKKRRKKEATKKLIAIEIM